MLPDYYHVLACVASYVKLYVTMLIYDTLKHNNWYETHTKDGLRKQVFHCDKAGGVRAVRGKARRS